MISELELFYQNVRGLRTKITELNEGILSNTYDVIVLTETWLHPGIHSGELFDDRYVIYRKDRDYEGLNQERGGGVLIAIKWDIFSERVLSLETDDKCKEDLWVKLRLNNNIEILLGTFYFPPNTNKNVYDNVFDNALRYYPFLKGNVIITGDFNLPEINFLNRNQSLTNNMTPKARSLLEFMQICDLQSQNDVPNYLNRTLDLVLTNIQGVSVSLEQSVVSHSDVYHPPLMLNLPLNLLVHRNYVKSQRGKETEFLNYAKADFLNMYYKFKDIDWSPLYQMKNSNEAVTFFDKEVQQVITSTVPIAKRKHNSYPPWFTHEIMASLKKKDRYRLKYRKSGKEEFFLAYKELRKSSKKLIRQARKNYETDIECGINEDPKKFWNYVNRRRKSNVNAGSLKYGGITLDTPDEIAAAFAQHFSSVFSSPSRGSTQDSAGAAHSTCVGLNCITHSEVRDALTHLKPKRTIGPDRIPPYIFKACFEFFCEPLTHIFNTIIRSAAFPSTWKVSCIVPVPKTDSTNEITNYRPISIIPVPAKIFESVVYKKIYDQVMNLISNSQHGFMEGRSVITNLVTFVDHTSSSLDHNAQVDVIYTDFQKAFDKVDHNILIRKLGTMGFSTQLSDLLRSYLSDRKQYVVYKGSNSNTFSSTSGVPQGSNLGPLLFLLFVNDITNELQHSRALLYADDLKLFKTVRSEEDTQLLQSDLNTLVEWSKLNNLPFNTSKCHVMTYTRKHKSIYVDYVINRDKITRVSEIRDLGVMLDTKLTFKNHVNYVVTKARRMLGFVIRNSFNFTRIETLQVLYQSLVRSQLEFASVVWNPTSAEAIKTIESVQKRLLKYLYYRQFTYYPVSIPYKELLLGYEIKSLHGRRNIASLTFLHNLIHNKIRDPETLGKIQIRVPSFDSRNKNVFEPPIARTEHFFNSPINYMMRLYNQISKIHSDIDILDSLNTTTCRRQFYEVLH